MTRQQPFVAGATKVCWIALSVGFTQIPRTQETCVFVALSIGRVRPKAAEDSAPYTHLCTASANPKRD
jgi:hypothetical protein